MKRFSALVISAAFLLFSSIGPANGAAETADGWGKTYKLNSLHKAEVKNKDGEKLGVIEDFIMDAKNGRIAFVVFAHAGMAGIGQKVHIISFDFFSFDEAGKNFVLDVAKEDLTQTIAVKDPNGEELGAIEELVMDPQGRIPFVILSHKDKRVMIPFSALSLDPGNGSFVLDANAEKLAAAPSFEEDSVNRGEAEKIYKYYGQNPYWTSDEIDQAVHPSGESIPEF